MLAVPDSLIMAQLLTFGNERTLRVWSQNEFRARLKWRHPASRASHLFFGLSFITRICTARKGSACRVVDLLGHGRRHGLGQSCGLCENLLPTHNLPQALTIGLSAKLSWVSSSSPTPPLIRLLRRLRNLRKTWKASSICGRCAHPTDSQLLPIPFSITTLCERSSIKRCDKVSPHYLQILETSSAQEDTSIAHFCAKRLASSLTFVYGIPLCQRFRNFRSEFKWKGPFCFGLFWPEYSGSPMEVVHIFRSGIPTEIRRSIFDKPVLCPN